MQGELPGSLLTWLSLMTLALIAQGALFAWLAWLLTHVQCDVTAILSVARLLGEDDSMWGREPVHRAGHGMAAGQLDKPRGGNMTLEERANLIDQRARQSYYHGEYCGQVPAVALQHLQEAVAEERERCARVVDMMMATTPTSPVVMLSEVAAAIRHNGKGGP